MTESSQPVTRSFVLIIIPAIDLKNGKCVRLLQGDFSRSTTYSDHPVDIAVQWQKKGAERIHIVDLDGSRTGSPQNTDVIREIVQNVDIPVEVGGGIRSLQTAELYLGTGARWVILGTAALKDRSFVMKACEVFKEAIILGIDAKDGEIMVEGWIEGSGQSAYDIAKSYEHSGVDAIVYTDISRDGMETGVNISATKKMAETVKIPIIASGGVAGIKDIEELVTVANTGIIGVIVGKALYTGALKIEDALYHVGTRGDQ